MGDEAVKILLCGPYLTEEMEMLLPEASPAAGKFLRNLRNGLINVGCSVRVASYLSIRVPSKSRGDILKEIEKRKEYEESYIFKENSVFKAVKEYRKMIHRFAIGTDYVLFYNSIYPTLFIQKGLKRVGINSGLILADFTEPEEYKSLARKTIAHLCKLDMGMYDKYVVLSSSVAEKVRNERNRIVVEVGIDDEILDKFYKPSINEKIIFYYSGYLTSENGVKNMIAAFKQIEKAEARLIISGKGPLEDFVHKSCKSDDRIKYLGYVENSEYYKLLNRANVLINPRNMDLPQNKNNFPSKIMEYLASGRIIISTKFPGWEHFKDNIEFCESNIDSIKEAFSRMCSISMSIQADVFEKNSSVAYIFSWKKQSEKIYCLLQKV